MIKRLICWLRGHRPLCVKFKGMFAGIVICDRCDCGLDPKSYPSAPLYVMTGPDIGMVGGIDRRDSPTKPEEQ